MVGKMQPRVLAASLLVLCLLGVVLRLDWFGDGLGGSLSARNGAIELLDGFGDGGGMSGGFQGDDWGLPEGGGGDGLGAKSRSLRTALHALQGATMEEKRLARDDQSKGSKELEQAQRMLDSGEQRARRAERDATGFMGKAAQLMASEKALEKQQVAVKRELGAIAAEHRNIVAWEACREGPGCEGGMGQDVWESATSSSPPSPHRTSARDGSSSLSRRSSGRAAGRGGSDGDLLPGKVGIKPYSASEWHDTKPVTEWGRVKPAALKAGYDLNNCMVAAQKDTGVVRVKIVEKVKAPLTKQGCTCKLPWTYYREKLVKGGEAHESSNLHSYDRCSMNGSPGKPWCAVNGDSCGVASDDEHAGHGEGKYGWTHWDYCDEGRMGWAHKTLWEATHSAGQVTCLAEFLIASDKATEWRALDLLRQQVVSGDKDEANPVPSEVSSRFEACQARAESADSAAFCETDMLSRFSQSMVRHALLIARASSLKIHWANRQRVYLLFTLQFQGCIDKARGKKEGEVCIAQLLSSMPEHLTDVAVSHALATPSSPQAPKTVEMLASRLVMCMQAATDKDAAAFCTASFLAHAPHSTTRAAAAMATKVRGEGTAGFPDVLGKQTMSGWTGFRDIVQAHNPAQF